MQNKFKLNRKYYFNNNTLIYYIKNCYRGKSLEYLQPYLQIDSLILFEIVNKLFTKLKKVYGDLHCKEYIIEKFKKLKISSKSFNTFYLKFIKLTTKLKYTKKNITIRIYT